MRFMQARVLRYVLLSVFACTAAVHALGQVNSVTITPLMHDFHSKAVGLKTDALDIDVANTGNLPVTLSSFRLDSPAFQLTQGIAPITLGKGVTTHYTVLFAPTQAGVALGHFQVQVSNGQVLSVKLKGTGFISTAQAQLSKSSLDFGTATQGQFVPKQTVVITNTGSQSTTLSQVLTSPPFSTNFTTSRVIPAGGTLNLTVTFNPTDVGPVTGVVSLEYDNVPAQGIGLSANVNPASSLAVSTFPTLQQAVQGAAYTASLTAASGQAPYTWKLFSGSTLPQGLTLSSGGVISGTVASSVKVANYTFTAQVTDSSTPPKSATKQILLAVVAPPGSSCNNIVWNVENTGTPILPLDVLGTGTYLGSEGGLYPDGSNTRPSDHTDYGIGLADAIQPLDANGNPDPVNGKIVVITVGESNVQIEGGGFADDAAVDPLKNPAVLVVNTGIGNATAAQLSMSTSPFWTTMTDYILPNNGVTAKQVQAAWVEPGDDLNSGTFPSDIGPLQSQIESEMQNLLIHFPNIKMAYVSSRIYAGYSNGLAHETNPEPYAYEDGFAVKWAIQDQLDGAANLNFDPSKGLVKAPWMSWGPYTWANGLTIPSADGTLWSCYNIKSDGVHPTTPLGREQVGHAVLDFFKTDATTTPWFLAK